MPLFPPRNVGGLGAQMEQPMGGLGGFLGGALDGVSRFNERRPEFLFGVGQALKGEDMWPAIAYGQSRRKERAAETAKAANELKVKRLLKSKGYSDEEIERYMAAGAAAQLLAPDKQGLINAGGGKIYDPNTKEWISSPAGVGMDEEAFKRERETRKDYDDEDVVKSYKKIRDSYERIRSSATSDSGPGDIGLIFNFMKMLDPGSVVREGEFATAQNSGGVEETIRSTYNALLSGERLTPEQRQKFVEAADGIYSEASANLGDVNERYTGISTNWQIDPSRVVVSPEKYEPLKLGQTKKLPNNVTIKKVRD